MRKIMCVLLALALLLAVLPGLAAPVRAEDEYAGSCGDKLTWRFDPDTGLLSIEGEGDMYDFKPYIMRDGFECFDSPWYAHRREITALSLPEGLTHIGSYAFANCGELDQAEIPGQVSMIGSYAFLNCFDLTRVEIPGSVKIIGTSAFSQCGSLEELVLHNGLTILQQEAFYDCVALRCVRLPDSVREIGGDAFGCCESLRLLVLTNPDCIVIGSVSNEPYDGSGGGVTYYDQSLGIPGQTVVCGLHDPQKENTPVHFIYDFTEKAKLIWSHYYLERYAIDFGYVFRGSGVFSDVDLDAYYSLPVIWAVDASITSGAGEGQFSPKQTCTREQIVTFLWKALGAPEPEASESPFSDVKPGKYYFKPVLWAVENGVTGGVGDGKFGVGRPCTREQAVSFLWKALGAPEPEGTESPFTDVKPGKYYYKPVLWAAENGVTGGVGDGKFGVGSSCTRAQIVTFLYKAFQN